MRALAFLLFVMDVLDLQLALPGPQVAIGDRKKVEIFHGDSLLSGSMQASSGAQYDERHQVTRTVFPVARVVGVNARFHGLGSRLILRGGAGSWEGGCIAADWEGMGSEVRKDSAHTVRGKRGTMHLFAFLACACL